MSTESEPRGRAGIEERRSFWVEAELRRISLALHRLDEMEHSMWEPGRAIIKSVLDEYYEELTHGHEG